MSNLDPEMDIPSNVTQIHHITNEMVQLVLKFLEVAAMMINIVNTIVSPQDIVVMFAHNGSQFDEPILKEQFITFLYLITGALQTPFLSFGSCFHQKNQIQKATLLGKYIQKRVQS